MPAQCNVQSPFCSRFRLIPKPCEGNTQDGALGRRLGRARLVKSAPLFGRRSASFLSASGAHCVRRTFMSKHCRHRCGGRKTRARSQHLRNRASREQCFLSFHSFLNTPQIASREDNPGDDNRMNLWVTSFTPRGNGCGEGRTRVTGPLRSCAHAERCTKGR